MLCDVLNDVEQDAAFGNLPAIPFESSFRVGIGHGADGCFGVGVGRLERDDDFCFIGGGRLEGFRVNSSSSGVPTSL